MSRALLERRAYPPDIEWPSLGGPSPGGRSQRIAVGLGVAFGLVVIVAGVVGAAGGGRARHTPTTAAGSAGTAAPAPSAVAASRSASASPGAGLSWHSPSTVIAAGTPAQEAYDQAFAQGLGGQPGMGRAATLAVPAAAITGGWPRLAVEVTPESWAQAFVAGLLDINYAGQSRPALAGWLQAEEAPEVIPGVPAAAADKVLYVSLLDPDLFGGQPTPVATAAQWASAASAGVTQSVSDLMVQADPTWAETVAAGWQPTDVRTTEEDVSGVLTVRHGPSATDHRFALQIIVGSARWHDGYGTVAVAGWQEP